MEKYHGFRSSSILTSRYRWIAYLVVGFLFLAYLSSNLVPTSRIPYLHKPTSAGTEIETETEDEEFTGAIKLSPRELLARPVTNQLQAMPKLIHQSWSSQELPAKFRLWSQSFQDHNPDWEWVLWTDEDNLGLVKRYFPWFLETYQSLKSVIYQADAIRNMYMYLFGGVYADLDTECLRSLDGLFESYNLTTLGHLAENPDLPGDTLDGRKAFFGRMGTDTGFQHSIPNAWMASTPGHPFFLSVLKNLYEKASDKDSKNMQPEDLTGPTALYASIQKYQTDLSGPRIEKMVGESPASNLFYFGPGEKHSVEILPWYSVYPYSWSRDGDAYRSYCSAEANTFNATRCKEVMATDKWPSYSITYWSHSWAADGHNDQNMKHISEDR